MLSSLSKLLTPSSAPRIVRPNGKLELTENGYKARSVGHLLNAFKPQYWREWRRAFNNHHYDYDDDGRIHLHCGSGMWFGGEWSRLEADGSLTYLGRNKVTVEGMNYLLNTGVHDGVKITAWYVAPFGNNLAPDQATTAATFPGTYLEITSYSESTRQEYVESAASGGSCSNLASPANITANATISVYGAALTSVNSKSSTSGTLLSLALYTLVQTISSGTVLGLTYTLSVSNPA